MTLFLSLAISVVVLLLLVPFPVLVASLFLSSPGGAITVSSSLTNMGLTESPRLFVWLACCFLFRSSLRCDGKGLSSFLLYTNHSVERHASVGERG